MPYTPVSSAAKTAAIKREIIALFNKNVRGKVADTSKSNAAHDGRVGHWLEDNMNLQRNGRNEPDYKGFEMKNHTRGKTSFGDWSADEYIFRRKGGEVTRNDFFAIFGSPNARKKGRLSWSGRPSPKVGVWNEFGQKLRVDRENNIFALYDYGKDKRPNKARLVPKALQKKVVIARWDAASMRLKVERKFNKRGWFKCQQNTKTGVYDAIVFGPPFNFDQWITGVRSGEIYLDSGMYMGNVRPYSNWRASNNYWDKLVIARY